MKKRFDFKKFIEKFTCLEMDELLLWLDSDPHPKDTLISHLEKHRPEWLKEIFKDQTFPRQVVNKWRTWEQLTEGEKWDIRHSDKPPSMKTELQNLWRITPNGWECSPREKVKEEDL